MIDTTTANPSLNIASKGAIIKTTNIIIFTRLIMVPTLALIFCNLVKGIFLFLVRLYATNPHKPNIKRPNKYVSEGDLIITIKKIII